MTDNDPTPSVEYREVPDYPYYRVGNDGSVQSRYTNVLRPGQVSWRPMRLQRHSGGYVAVHFYIDGKRRPKFVHRLVLEAFVGPCPDGMEACHNNGNRADNRVENLRWDTKVNNHADKRDHGTLAMGSMIANSKLHESVIPAIRRLAEMGIYQWQIAQAFEVEQSLVSQIVTGKIWKHVE